MPEKLRDKNNLLFIFVISFGIFCCDDYVSGDITYIYIYIYIYCMYIVTHMAITRQRLSKLSRSYALDNRTTVAV
jgi:hypothetical protein